MSETQEPNLVLTLSEPSVEYSAAVRTIAALPDDQQLDAFEALPANVRVEWIRRVRLVEAAKATAS